MNPFCRRTWLVGWMVMAIACSSGSSGTGGGSGGGGSCTPPGPDWVCDPLNNCGCEAGSTCRIDPPARLALPK